MAEEFKISEWLAKAKEDPKVAAQPLIIVAAVLFGGYKFAYSPKVIELDKELKKNKKVETDIKSVQSAVNNIEDIKLDIEEKKASFNKAKTMCYRKGEMTSFLRRVREIAQKAGIEVKSVNPQPISPIAMGEIAMEKFPVSFFYTGDLTTLGTFLRLIELEEKITFLTMPTLSPNASGTFEVELTPTTILLPDSLAIEPAVEP